MRKNFAFYGSPTVGSTRSLRWTGHVARMRNTRTFCGIIGVKIAFREIFLGCHDSEDVTVVLGCNVRPCM
jgi:hypothetical protein